MTAGESQGAVRGKLDIFGNARKCAKSGWLESSVQMDLTASGDGGSVSYSRVVVSSKDCVPMTTHAADY